MQWGVTQPRYEKSFVGGVRIFILNKYIGEIIKNLTVNRIFLLRNNIQKILF